jgi:phosphate transport system protein
MSNALERTLEDLRARVTRMTARVQTVVELASDAVFRMDVNLAHQAVNSDEQVDIDEMEVERIAIECLARYAPAANDLRFLTSVIKVNSDFERIADCAVNVAQRIPTLARSREQKLPDDLIAIAHAAMNILRDTVNAFNLPSIELAEKVIRADDALDAYYHQIVQDELFLLEKGPNVEAERELAMIMIGKNYERIGDHCTNIAEDIIYIHSGRLIRHRRGVGEG